MRAIIGGLRYDTEQAELVHEWDNGLPVDDIYYRAKALYRTDSGRWFIHHEGGPATDVGRHIGNNTIIGGERIEPVSEAEAFEFLISHGGEDAAEEYFPDRIRDA